MNDRSTEKEYYEYNWKENGINIIHLDINSKQIFGFACAGYVRNKGIEKSSGKYIAVCDDDDIWFPSKIELQLNAMKDTGCKMSSTDGLHGNGMYDSNKQYARFNADMHRQYHIDIYKSRNITFPGNKLPKIWNKDFLKINNCVICSSVLIEKEILTKINNMKCVRNGEEDYDCWLRALEHTNSVYVEDICFYYDGGHGYGQNY